MGGKGSGNPNIKNYGFGSRPIEEDELYRSRQTGVPHKRKWTKEVCVAQLEELMDLLKDKIEGNDFKELQVIIDKMMDIIRYLYPPVQQSVNVNIDTTADSVIERLKNWKQEQVIVIGENEQEVTKCQQKIKPVQEVEVVVQEMEEEQEKDEQEEKE